MTTRQNVDLPQTNFRQNDLNKRMVELDAVEILFLEYKYERISIATLHKSIQALPTINPLDTTLAEIDKMIEEEDKLNDSGDIGNHHLHTGRILRKLKSRLLSLKL